MRSTISAVLVSGFLALSASQASAAPPAPMASRADAAISADAYAVKASYQGPAQGHGYSPIARHIADCLATYPNYDPETDLVRVRPGVVRRCTL